MVSENKQKMCFGRWVALVVRWSAYLNQLLRLFTLWWKTAMNFSNFPIGYSLKIICIGAIWICELLLATHKRRLFLLLILISTIPLQKWKKKINSHVTNKSHISNRVMVNKSQKRSFFGVIFFTLVDKVISKTTNKFALESIFFRSL